MLAAKPPETTANAATITTIASVSPPAAAASAPALPSLKAWRVARAARRPSEAEPAGRGAAAAAEAENDLCPTAAADLRRTPARVLAFLTRFERAIGAPPARCGELPKEPGGRSAPAEPRFVSPFIP